MAFNIVLFANSFYERNIDLVGENEVTSTLDLLQPKWKEKIVMGDPTIAGGAAAWFTWTVVGVFGRDKGVQFMKDLAAQKPMVTRDERQLIEWVAKGKYPIGFGTSMSVSAEFVQMGAPIAFIDMKEPRSLSPGEGVINVFKNVPHPNARKLFLNWILSKEGGSIFAPAMQYPSTRLDVSTEGILPVMVPRPGETTPDSDEGYLVIKAEMLKVAAGIFGGPSK